MVEFFKQWLKWKLVTIKILGSNRPKNWHSIFNNNNNNRYLETLPIKTYRPITAFTKTEKAHETTTFLFQESYKHIEEKNEKRRKALTREEMCVQKFLKLVCGFSGSNERTVYLTTEELNPTLAWVRRVTTLWKCSIQHFIMLNPAFLKYSVNNWSESSMFKKLISKVFFWEMLK